MADRPSLEVQERAERGSRETRRLRREGLIPGVLYGGSHDETVTFKVNHRDLRSVLVDGSALIDVKIGSEKSVPAILKDQQVHPVRGDVMHVDFLEVRLDQKIQATVAVELEGADESPGVKEGGVLEQITRELNIEALPTAIPESISHDVSGMDINDTITLAALTVPPGITLLDDLEETTLATLSPPRIESEDDEIEEETGLVGEGAGRAEGADADADAGDVGDASSG